MQRAKIKVLVVDDSLLIRQVVSDMLNSSPDFEVIGTAHNGKSALEKIAAQRPDAVTLDVEMPVMDGIECLRAIVRDYRLPVIMVSSITYEGGFKTLQALEAGAFDFIQKPKAQDSNAMAVIAESLKAKLKAAVASPRLRAPVTPAAAGTPRQTPYPIDRTFSAKDHVIAVGISTGGPPCITQIFQSLPKDAPPVLVVQHMPEGFTKAMAERINKISAMDVREATDGDVVERGRGYIAPGNFHVGLESKAGVVRIRLSQAPAESGHRPSVDTLFRSVESVYGQRAVAVLMTGMGRDGATELGRLKTAGAHTIAQDEASCVVFGMPKAAIQEHAATEVLSLDAIVARLKKLSERKS